MRTNFRPNQFIVGLDARPHGLNLVSFQRTDAEGYAICSASFEDGKCVRSYYSNPDDSGAFIRECEEFFRAEGRPA